MTAILGLSAFYHDSAAALLVDGTIVAAAQEERFTRVKNDDAFPAQAVQYCLDQAGLSPADLDYVGFYDKPLLKFERLLETYLAYVPRGFESFRLAMPVWLRQKLHLPREMNRALGHAYRKRYIFTEHHESHAASAFFPSPFEEAAILTLDGVGEWATASYGVGRGNRLELTHEMRFPHSLGLLYSAFTYYCGFKVNSGEYKLMGLAPYGQPRYADLIRERIVRVAQDGSIQLDLSYFNYCAGLTMTSRKFDELFGGPPRQPDTLLTERDMDLAASIQQVTEEVMLRAVRHLHRETGMKNLCLAGGVALNCVGNGRILREGPFERLWIQPAAGDAGGALGVAWFIWHQLLEQPRVVRPGDSQSGSLLGPAFDDEAIGTFLDGAGAASRRLPDDAAVCDEIAGRIAGGQVVGWFQGRMEFGPRALGSRSILGDARNRGMQSVMNVKVKFRESFRPFAPAVLREQVDQYFDMRAGEDSPYMLIVAPLDGRQRLAAPDAGQVRGIDMLSVERSTLPAITHVDYSARVQTVDAERHGLYHQLLERYREMTGCAVIVNTSFNLGWDPIVCTPSEAYHTFMSSDIDVLCMGHHVLAKDEQPAHVPAVSIANPAPALDGLWSCPTGDGGALARAEHRLVCLTCGRPFDVEAGIPRLCWPQDLAGDRSNVTPVPNYDDHDSVRVLIEKARRSVYANELNAALPFNTTVLEVGCGTGQLTNFLGVSCRRVIGADMCLSSLRLGEAFRRQHGLSRVRFVQMNPFRPCFKAGVFDVILCNGVRHDTAGPAGGLHGLVPLLRPGGYIVIGLHNRYGRCVTDLRRQILGQAGNRADQRPPPSGHTIDEVLDWFAGAGLQFVRGLPSTVPGQQALAPGTLLDPVAAGSRLDHLLVQLKQVVTGSREGGLFLMIGRKPAEGAATSLSAPRRFTHVTRRDKPQSVVA